MYTFKKCIPVTRVCWVLLKKLSF